MPRPYRSFSGSMVDAEKQQFHHLESYDVYEESDAAPDSVISSSRNTRESSCLPMLRHLHPHMQRLPLPNYVAWSRRFSKRHFTRYFTLAISTSLLLFIFFLLKASWVSQAEVLAGVAQKQSIPEWEHFPSLQKYFGGIRSLVDRTSNDAEYPLAVDDEISRLEQAAMQRKANEDAQPAAATAAGAAKRQDWQSRAQRFDPFSDLVDKPVSCQKLVTNGTSIPQILAYTGVPRGFPNPVIGSYDVLNLRNDVCFDRFGRLGPYGFGYSQAYGGSSAGMDGDTDDKDAVWAGSIEVDYRNVNWADAQEDCIALNKQRFRKFHSVRPPKTHWTSLHQRDLDPDDAPEEDRRSSDDDEQAASTSTPDMHSTTQPGNGVQTEPLPFDTTSPHMPGGRLQGGGLTSDDSKSKTAPPPSSNMVQPSMGPPPSSAHYQFQPVVPPSNALPSLPSYVPYEPPKPHEESKDERRLLPRTAVLIRTWDDYKYDDEDMFNLRAMINELSIQSGGEYEIRFLVHLKNESQSVWADASEYKRVLRAALPEEFDGMGTLWSEKQMALLYGALDDELWHNLPVHGVYRSAFLPVQYFAEMHPQYDFIWNWEMDIRYTGHFYHLFDRASKWSKDQPRKGLWDRSARFYVPAKHGSYEDFRQMVRVQTEQGAASRANTNNRFGAGAGNNNAVPAGPETPVWGSHPPDAESDRLDGSHDPVPPVDFDRDNYHWGIGEDADLITFNPLFDPAGTEWIISDDVVGYNSSTAALPRRASIGTAIRLSRRLLRIMHSETALHKHALGSEMWPATMALHHGFKAVYVPHPVYIDRAWPTSYLAAVFNNGHDGASGGAQSSVFSDRRQHNFKGSTWYYDATFGAKLWQRWLGYKVDEQGGEESEVMGEGRMCLPPMLLHPVKQVDLIVERAREPLMADGVSDAS